MRKVRPEAKEAMSTRVSPWDDVAPTASSPHQATLSTTAIVVSDHDTVMTMNGAATDASRGTKRRVGRQGYAAAGAFLMSLLAVPLSYRRLSGVPSSSRRLCLPMRLSGCEEVHQDSGGLLLRPTTI